MKQLKRLNRSQKEVLTAHNLNWKNWGLIEETDFYIKVMNRESGKTKRLDKFWKGVKIK